MYTFDFGGIVGIEPLIPLVDFFLLLFLDSDDVYVHAHVHVRVHVHDGDVQILGLPVLMLLDAVLELLV